jgi:hypothetical protein
MVKCIAASGMTYRQVLPNEELEKKMKLTANGIQIEYEVFGPEDGVPLVLIRGLGSQLIHWPDELMSGFADLGYRVVIFDNRDVIFLGASRLPSQPAG